MQRVFVMGGRPRVSPPLADGFAVRGLTRPRIAPAPCRLPADQRCGDVFRAGDVTAVIRPVRRPDSARGEGLLRADRRTPTHSEEGEE